MDIDSTSYISPNHNSRKLPISMIVVHSTADDNEQKTTEYMCNPAPYNAKTKQPDPDLAVSCHYVIWHDGSIKQLVDDHRRAWHAGESVWGGLHDINSASLGIEIVNKNDGKDPYRPAQIDALTELVRLKMHQYDIYLDNVVRHLDIAPKRKTDPAGFPWADWKETLVQVDRWSLWGTQFPLHINARTFGIPQAWYASGIAEQLGEARSHEIFLNGYSYIAFERGLIVFSKNKPHVLIANTLK